jgi:hypothetical protein
VPAKGIVKLKPHPNARTKPIPSDHDGTGDRPCARLDQMEATLLREVRMPAERVIGKSPEVDQ